MSLRTSLSVASILSFTKSNADIGFADVVTKNATTPGFLSQACGDRVEEPPMVQWFIRWNSTVSTPVDVSDHFSKISEESVKCVDVAFTSDPTTAIKAPITEILTAMVQPGIDADLLGQMTTNALTVMDGAAGFFGASWGLALNDRSKIVILAGWSGKEAHQTFTEADSAKQVFAQWLAFVIATSITQEHVGFKDFESV